MSESGNILDNEEVDFLLEGEEQNKHDASPQPSEGTEQAVTMRGDLDQINLSDIFQTLSMTKMEGVLRIHNPLEQRQVYCKDGFLRILTPPRVIQRRIGQRLVAANLITTEQLRSALMRQRKERLPIGQILVADGIITNDQIEDVASVQVAEDLFAIFTWNHGAFEFYRGPVEDPELRENFRDCPEFEISSLLLEVARRSDEWETILESIGNLDELPIATTDEPPRELGELEFVLFRNADGRRSYRHLAEQSTQSLFEAARVARDLVREGLIVNLSDEQMIEAAAAFTDEGTTKQAVIVLQTLRDRDHDLDIEIVRGMAHVLERAGERKLAGLTLLEVAERQTNPEATLEFAREAADFAPHDPATLRFLRQSLLQLEPHDNPEVEEVTGKLIDSMLADDLIDEALAIIEEARFETTPGPALLLREARVQQRLGNAAGAITAFEEVAELFREQGDVPRVREALEQILRLDRRRKDVARQLKRLSRSKTTQAIRIAAITIVLVLAGSMGLVIWQQDRFESAVREAGNEISALIAAGDRNKARERLVHWAHQLGECPEADDLRRQVEFADAAELQRQARAERERTNERLVTAAEMLDKGQLRSALVVYDDLRSKEANQAEIESVVNTRLKALLADIDSAAKIMATRLPEEPNRLMHRRQLVDNLADIKTVCQPALYVLVDDLLNLHDGKELPAYLAPDLRADVDTLIERHRATFERARDLLAAYTRAVEKSDRQREYDPVFKKALDCEEAHDFAGALELFQELQKSEVDDPALRALFRDHVTRNATIVKLMGELGNATGSGNYATALQQLKALKLAFEDVPFEKLVRLPLKIESDPVGAAVHCNGAEIGKTPCIVAFIPAEENRFRIALDGFEARDFELVDHESLAGQLGVQLVFAPAHSMAHGNSVDKPPLTLNDGTLVFTDRGGNAFAMKPGATEPHWTFKSGDLSGLLSRPFGIGGNVVFASLDGKLRCVDGKTGVEIWSLPDLPTEVEPVQFDTYLVAATTTGRLVVTDLEQQEQRYIDLPDSDRVRLLRAGSRLVVVTRTSISAHKMPSLKLQWSAPFDNLTDLHVAAADDVIIAVDSGDTIRALAPLTGDELWRGVADSPPIASPMIAGRRALFVSEREVLSVAALDGSQRRVMKAEHDGWKGIPGLAGDRLLLRTIRGDIEAYALGSGRRQYVLDGDERGTCILPWRTGIIVAVGGRDLRFFPKLR